MNKKFKTMSSAQILNVYMKSGGTKARYEDVVAAVKKERMDKSIQRIKDKYNYLSIIIIPLFVVITFLDEFLEFDE